MQIYLLKRKGKLSKQKQEAGKQAKISLYLVTYLGKNTKREYEFLGLSIFEKPKTQLQKDHNKETMQLAESIRAKRLLEIQSSQYGFRSSTLLKLSFFEYFNKLALQRREASESNYEKWMTVYKLMKKYTDGKDITMGQVNEDFLEGLKEFLASDKGSVRFPGKKLGKNSATSYFNIVKTALNEAYRGKLLRENPSHRVKCMRGEETHREYLTIEEIQLLAKTACVNETLKKAFLFSALTGLRWSDVSRITWGQLTFNEVDGWAIHYTQKKTGKAEILPISDQAVKVLGKQEESEYLIIRGLRYNSYMNQCLREWVTAAGINKYITFHCARHTFATLQLSINTDIYTISKMLGHKHLRTTEIYAKVIDKKKIDAVRRIPQINL